MSQTAATILRWGLAFSLIVLGILSALFSIGILGFTSWGCYKETNDISVIILYTVMAFSVLGGIIPAIMMIRKAKDKFVVIAIVVSLCVILVGNAIYVFYNLNIC